MTKRGITLLIFLAPTVFVAFAFSAREIFVLACALLLMFLYSGISVLFAAFSLKSNECLFSDTLTRSDYVSFKVILHGVIFLPIVIEYRILPLESDKKKNNYIRNVLFRMIGKCSENLEFNITCPHRGIWNLEHGKIYIRDIFGFFSIPSFNKNNKRSHELIVFPRLLVINVEQQYIPPHSGDSEAGKVVADLGDNFSGTRSYHFGDQLRRIHWKQTVRTREIHVRKYENDIDPNVLIVLDTNCLAKSTCDYADIATEAAIAMTYYYIKNNQSIRLLVLHTDHDDTKKTLDHVATKQEGFEDIFDMLAIIPFQNNEDGINISQLENTCFEQVKKICIITDNPSYNFVCALSDYADIGYTINLIIPQCENGTSNNSITSQPFVDGLTAITISDPDQIGVSWGDWL